METVLNKQYSKEDIIQRMVFAIAKKWQINEKEVQAKFDPLMMMLVQVIAHELDAINARWELSVDDITETIIRKYFPEYPIAEELPHTTIIQASAAENHVQINEFFTCSLQQDITFTPLENTHLLGLQLHSLWMNGKPFDNSFGFQSKEQEKVRTIGILCEADAGLTSVNKLQLHIATGNVGERELLLYAIKHGSCYANGTPVSTASPGVDEHVAVNDYWSRLKSLAHATYDASFVQIEQQGNFERLKADGSVWQALDDRQKKELDINSLVYLHWELPIALQYRWLSQLSIYPNAFVAVSRARRTVQYKVEPLLNIIPLTIDRQLMYIDAVASDTGQSYNLREAVTDDTLTEGNCCLRSGQFGNMNSDMLRYNIQSLKEEVDSSAAFFSGLSNDSIVHHLKDMQRIAYRLQDKMQYAGALKQQIQYLLVKPYRNDKFITVDYWTFDNGALKTVKPDAVLDCKGTQILKSSAKIVDKPYALATEYTNSLNRPLQQISSRRDIEQLARNVFGSYFLEVKVERKYISTADVHARKQLTIAIDIFLAKGYNVEFQELDSNRINYELAQNGLLSYPYSITIKQHQS